MSGYRDDSETLRARIETLESELATANETIARLRGDAIVPDEAPTSTGALESAKPTWMLGAPSRLVVRREVPVSAGDRELQAVVQLLSARFGRYGQTTNVGRAIVYRIGTLEFTLTPTESGTHLQLIVDHRGMLIMPVLIAFIAMSMTLPFVGATYGPQALMYALPAAFVLGFAAARYIFARYVRGFQARCRGTVETIAALLERASQVRVAAPVAEEEEEEPLEEAEPAKLRR